MVEILSLNKGIRRAKIIGVIISLIGFSIIVFGLLLLLNMPDNNGSVFFTSIIIVFCLLLLLIFMRFFSKYLGKRIEERNIKTLVFLIETYKDQISESRQNFMWNVVEKGFFVLPYDRIYKSLVERYFRFLLINKGNDTFELRV